MTVKILQKKSLHRSRNTSFKRQGGRGSRSDPLKILLHESALKIGNILKNNDDELYKISDVNVYG